MSISQWIPQWIQDKVTTGQQINDALDTAFTELDNHLGLEGSRIDTIIGDINIIEAVNVVQQQELDALALLNYYEFNHVGGTSTTSKTYSQLNRLTLPASTPAGTYMIQFNVMFGYNQVGRSSFFQASDEGGANPIEIRREAKDLTDVNTFDHSYPHVHAGGILDLVLEFRTEKDGDVLTIYGSNIVVERKV